MQLPDIKSDVDIVAEYIAKQKDNWYQRYGYPKHVDTSTAEVVVLARIVGRPWHPIAKHKREELN